MKLSISIPNIARSVVVAGSILLIGNYFFGKADDVNVLEKEMIYYDDDATEFDYEYEWGYSITETMIHGLYDKPLAFVENEEVDFVFGYLLSYSGGDFYALGFKREEENKHYYKIYLSDDNVYSDTEDTFVKSIGDDAKYVNYTDFAYDTYKDKYLYVEKINSTGSVVSDTMIKLDNEESTHFADSKQVEMFELYDEYPLPTSSENFGEFLKAVGFTLLFITISVFLTIGTGIIVGRYTND